ncbi:DNA-processing protein DprA [Actinomadura luteofluorescens]|uniref:DNA-processing protein DprA n=1 Tax=Actinomadura luteofluorescens TaxID=46163 RepID=UPI0021643AA6|nr:DNA-processing protein DprA [Actinomadura glauciflava]
MTAGIPDESVALVALLQTRPDGISWSEITAGVLEAGSAVRVWEGLHQPTLMDAPGETSPLVGAARDLAEWADQGNTILTVLDPEYPERLKSIHQAPPILFARGSLVEKDQGVSVVGSRNASPRGLEIAANVAHELAMRKVTVIAGLAAGIDTAAHRAALDAGGRTVAVIGTGINKVYPAANRALHEEIAAKGLLLSQFWPDAPPQKHTFLMRNATMSGYGIATFVVEAGEISGARAQARMAVEHGRPVILTDLVVERNQWAKLLIDRPGVHVAESTGDVMAVVDGLIKTQAFVGDALQNLAS